MFLVERLVTVLALKSFEDYREGEQATVWMSERVAHLVANQYLRLLHDPQWGAVHASTGED
jgi:hypothetical protein